jgi:hypothetical protein
MVSLGSVNVPKLKGRNQLYEKRNKSMPVFSSIVKPFNYFLPISPMTYVQKCPQIGIDFVKN